MPRNCASEISSIETPTIRNSGINPAWNRRSNPGSSFRRAKSPVAPKMMIACGGTSTRPRLARRVEVQIGGTDEPALSYQELLVDAGEATKEMGDGNNP